MVDAMEEAMGKTCDKKGASPIGVPSQKHLSFETRYVNVIRR
jgi:hypothetical protein